LVKHYDLRKNIKEIFEMKKLTNKYIYIILIISILTIIAYININQNNIDSNQLQLEFLEVILSTRNQDIIDSNQEISTNEQIKLEEMIINKNLKNLVYLTNAGDGSNDIFLVSQEGLIYYLKEKSEYKEPILFLDIQNKVNFGGEKGLLGLAFDPEYEKNNHFFIYYIDLNGNTVISRFTNMKSTIDILKTELIILRVNQPYSNHNGGQIIFGSDGYLYIGLGDGGAAGDPLGHGQNGKTLLGSILRINVQDATIKKPYQIPNDNPFIDNNNFRNEIWAYGLRNPWRMSFDHESGKLFVGDVGQNEFEEINIIKKGGNYGWSIMEGKHCYSEININCNKTEFILPILEYSHKEGCSITGGFVYHGNANNIQNQYIFSDFCSGIIWTIDLENNEYVKNQIATGPFKLSSFGEDEKKEVYILSLDGQIYKIINIEK
tara:strand:- start:4135 stop:5436 length:1302 start_codon:yes stop_codon:yes gene_type:complete